MRRGWRGPGGVRMVARGSCAAAVAATAAAVGWETGERNRRDDNICIIFNARTSGLRGGRQPPPVGHLLPRRLLQVFSPALLVTLRPSVSLITALLCRHPRTPPHTPFLLPLPLALATPSNIPLKSIPPHCLLYLPKLIIRTQIYCVSLAARNIPRKLPRISGTARLRFRSSPVNFTRPI